MVKIDIKKIFPKWDETDTLCECGAIKTKVRGITRQNMKKLITPKWDTTEILLTLIIGMVIVISLLYNSETKTCREFLNGIADSANITSCESVCTDKCEMIKGTSVKYNASLLERMNELNVPKG